MGCLVLNTGLFSQPTALVTQAPLPEKHEHAALSSLQANWVFSGVVTNEQQEQYPFFFQLRRDNEQLHVTATLIDAQTNTVLLYEDSEAPMDPKALPAQWHVGHAFLRFNAVNNSWLLGVKTPDHTGFHFKVDTLEDASHALTHKQDLLHGLALLVNQTRRVNGYVQLNESKEMFVSAKKVWFRTLWATDPKQTLHSLNAVLCDFNNGNGFYSVNLQDAKALRGAVAGWRNEQGNAVTMSQFVRVIEQQDGHWQINVPTPNVTLSLNNIIPSKHLKAGVVAGNYTGFCAITDA